MGSKRGLGGGGERRPSVASLAFALLVLQAAGGHLLPVAASAKISAPEPGPEDTNHSAAMQQEPGDLLALETATTRILTVGRPPYAAAAATTTTSNSTALPQANLQSPLRLYRLSQSAQATPIFLRQPASGQDLRLYLYPNQAAHNSSQVGLKVSNQTSRATTTTTTTTTTEPTTKSLFPSLATPEDEFERQLAIGHHQRLANTSTNMNWGQLLRQAALDNVMESLMVTNRSMVSLVCDTDDMLVRLRFKQPFRGLVATKLDRLRSCRLVGTGAHHYEWRIPLNSCGTRQEQPRLFINNIQIQFHQQDQLDTADDELKTLVCSYPLKLRAPPPEVPTFKKGLSERIVEEPNQVAQEPPVRLVHYEPLILISGLLLLALTLLGLAAGAYLVTRRHRHRRLRSLSSSSNISSRLYRPPAQLAHLQLAPPLISIAKTKTKTKTSETRTSRKPRQRQTVDAIQYSQPVSMEPKPQTKPNNSTSSDSLATDRSSVTTIEIPFLKPKEQENTTKSDRNEKSPAPVKKPKRVTKEREVQVDSGPPRFGSLRATLTSPNEFRRLQDIARIFDEILIEEHVDKGNDKTLVFKTTRLSPSKYKTKILDKMDESERRQVSKLIGQDELFRSLVVESTNSETFRRKLRNSPIYKDLLKPDTWNLLEEILLDPDLTSNVSTSETTKYHAQKNNQQLELVPAKVESVLAQREILSHPSNPSKIDDKTTASLPHQTTRPTSSPINHYREDSLEDQSTGKRPRLEVGTQASQEVNSEGENKVKRSVVKVRQFNSTRTITNGAGGDGFGSTMINIDSVTNFSTSSSSKEGFSTFTRSSIEHNRYHARGISDSSEDDGQKL